MLSYCCMFLCNECAKWFCKPYVLMFRKIIYVLFETPMFSSTTSS